MRRRRMRARSSAASRGEPCTDGLRVVSAGLHARLMPLIARQFALWELDRVSPRGNLLLEYGIGWHAEREAVRAMEWPRFSVFVTSREIELEGAHGAVILTETGVVLHRPGPRSKHPRYEAAQLLSRLLAWLGAYEQWMIDNHAGQRTPEDQRLRNEWWQLAAQIRGEAAAESVLNGDARSGSGEESSWP